MRASHEFTLILAFRSRKPTLGVAGSPCGARQAKSTRGVAFYRKSSLGEAIKVCAGRSNLRQDHKGAR